MKESKLSYYNHEVDSHHHWKFKRLRKKYGWEGEGKFWALNNLIAQSDKCLLDLSDENKLEQVATDLDFEKDEFLEYLNYLEINCKLVGKKDGNYITKSTQETLEVVEKAREADRIRKLNVKNNSGGNPVGK